MFPTTCTFRPHLSPVRPNGWKSAGLIARVPDEANLRRNKLTATEAGRARLMQMRAVFDALDARTFRGFSGAELASLSSMLNRMIQNSARGDAAQKRCTS